MTGPGRSPSSPWAQAPQGYSHDNRTASSFHPVLSPSQTGLPLTSSEQPSPNYFGLNVENSSNPLNSNPGLHTQKNWGSGPSPQSSLPSPKLQYYSQASVSDGLVNLLRSESDIEKGRRESALQRHASNGHAPFLKDAKPSYSYVGRDDVSNNRMQGYSSGNGLAPEQRQGSISHVDTTSISSRWITSDRCAHLLQSGPEKVLLLDVRAYTYFAQANIKGSLNLCIPTTLLKRRSFDTKKIEGTFTNDIDKQHFAEWKVRSMIIVYDSNTADAKDAAPLLNVISKFEAEGWEGEGLILQNGFKGFSSRFPRLVCRPQIQTAGPSPKKRSSMNINLGSVAPVVGGCALPESSSAANPFFANIRQNMDLMGGVGQIALKLPDHMTEPRRQNLPPWLQVASDAKDQGRIVSEKFLDLEKKELERMKQALSYEEPAAAAGGAAQKYRVAGIEKGTKNRYNDIYPFDHSRVRLEGVPLGDCDYVNANHIQAELSNRRYIATQAPVPDTFNDFWRVVWEQDVRLLVSLTAEMERGQVKSHPYWRSGKYGPFKVKAYSERFINVESKGRPVDLAMKDSNLVGSQARSPDESNENPVIIVRHFSIQHLNFPFEPLRDITQIHYPYWPDFGTTSQPTHLLNLIEQCNKVIRATSEPKFGSQEPEPQGQRPILVHCSAGCGRTGTFCTVDSVLDMLKRQRTRNKFADSTDIASGLPDPNLDLIAKTVEDFRTQRPSMVQNLSQFVLCYESVLEWVASQDKDS
ncbi:hypothetical protein N7532_009110 [Penicillium argentinense]|uniref:protein-tyrosine-phosphatase n=1 Tax=Penicillium argentinense TaxID=1131581 RepID=A0A9W9EYX7_9EURO|nr:uncharacterized protein N7532_009110 [Penicillium argentinense]KAJ5090426.1 hypothetical protein N7532_009110 [Penicillium argentinense]